MPQLDNNQRYMIHLLHCAFNDLEPQSAEGVDYSAVLDMAQEHQVISTIAPALDCVPSLPDDCREYVRQYNLNYIRTSIFVNNERDSIYSELSEKGIRYMPLKGSILRYYYPRETMRQMGDTDVYYDERNRDAVADIMTRHGYVNVSSSENSDDYKKAPRYIFEFHRSLFFDEADFHPVFDNLWEHATADADDPMCYHMGIDDLYIHSVCHMYKHFSYGGCGVRFLADIYLMLRRDMDALDWDIINRRMTEYGISDYERTCRELAFAMFDGRELTDEQTALLLDFLDFGIFGKESKKVGSRLRHFANGEQIDSRMRRRYMLSRLFPSKKKMVADYRVLEKRIYLLPAMYIHRIVGAVRNRDKIKQEIEYINDTE